MDSQALQRQFEGLRMLKELSRAMNTEGDATALLGMILDRALRLTRAERGFLVLREQSGALDIVVARQLNRAQIEQPAFKVSRGVIDEAFKSSQPVILDNAKDDPAYGNHASVVLNKPLSLACIPLKLKGTVIGALYLDSRLRTGLFTPDGMMFLEMFADNAATGVALMRMQMQVRLGTPETVPPPTGSTPAAGTPRPGATPAGGTPKPIP